MDMTFFLIMFAVSYLMGSLSSAIIICKLCGLPDPRTKGSGNPGATNVLRFGGKQVATAVLLGDVFKGIVPVVIVVVFGAPAWVATLTAFFAFTGHVFPIFFGFRGGKGVATYLGTMLGVAPIMGVIAIAAWLVTALVTRYSSLSAVVMSIAVPIAGYFFLGWAAALPLVLMTIILLFRHHENIKRLMDGKEPKIGKD
jgi:glycerol-3-phosphate acyltransferase PlsY